MYSTYLKATLFVGLPLLLTVLIGCSPFAPYGGFYRISQNHCDEKCYERLAARLESALAEFGFRRVGNRAMTRAGYVEFQKARSAQPAEAGARLDGSKSSIGIGIDMNLHSVMIKDHDRHSETPFVMRVKETVEIELQKIFDKKVEFVSSGSWWS